MTTPTNRFRIPNSVFALLSLLPLAASAQEAPLRSSDRIVLRIGGVPAIDQQEIAGDYPISDGGTIRLPYLGDLQASGYKPSDLARAVEHAYINAEIYTIPTVTIAPSSGPSERRITISGEVRGPGPTAFQDGMTLLEAIATAGGLSDFANAKQIRIVRDGQATVFDLRKIAQSPELDPQLAPKDMIVVPR